MGAHKVLEFPGCGLGPDQDVGCWLKAQVALEGFCQGSVHCALSIVRGPLDTDAPEMDASECRAVRPRAGVMVVR